MPEAIDTAYVVIRPDTRGFGAETKRQVQGQLAGGVAGAKGAAAAPVAGVATAGKSIGRSMIGATAAITGVTIGIGAMFKAVSSGFDEIKEAQAVLAQTRATIASTKGVAGVTADEVTRLAGSLSDLSGVDDEVIQQGQNLILTFKNVRNIAGENNDIFNRASEAALDLSVKGFGSVAATSKQMGKALNDPIKGMTALGRAGVTFSAAQKAQIKGMVENNNVLGAQKLILKEVESQVGGSAKAFGQTLPGQLGKLKNSFTELIAAGLQPIIPALTKGVGAVADFFKEMQRGEGIGADVADGFKVVKNALVPLFAAIKSEGPRIRRIFEGLRDIVRQSMPALKLIGILIGVTLVIAFKLAIRAVENMIRVWKIVQKVIVEAVQAIIYVIDKVLGAFQGMAEAASHIPFVGDKFDGVADAIGTAREEVRGFSEDLDAVNGKEVNVTVRTEFSTGPGGPGDLMDKPTERPDAGLDPNKTGKDAVTPPGPRQQKETVLLNTVALARAKAGVEDDKRALAALAAFYAESIRLAKERGVGTRVYEAQRQEALNAINDINAQAAADSKQAADDAKALRDENRAAALEEQRANLEANVEMAALTEGFLRDDKKAYAKLIAFLKARVTAAKIAGVGIAAAKAELRAAKKALADILFDAKQARLDERETLLEGAVTLAEFTPKKSDDERALKNLIAFYRQRVKDSKLSRVERQKYQIELRRTQQDLKELNEETSKTGDSGASFQRQAFDFLTTLKGFSSTLASNINPRGFSAGLTEATIAARGAVGAAATDAGFFGPPMGTGKGPDGGPIPGKAGIAPKGPSAAEVAMQNRADMQGPATAAQFERLLSTAQQTLRVLRKMAADNDHPEAKYNKKQSSAAVVVGVS